MESPNLIALCEPPTVTVSSALSLSLYAKNSAEFHISFEPLSLTLNKLLLRVLCKEDFNERCQSRRTVLSQSFITAKKFGAKFLNQTKSES